MSKKHWGSQGGEINTSPRLTWLINNRSFSPAVTSIGRDLPRKEGFNWWNRTESQNLSCWFSRTPCLRTGSKPTKWPLRSGRAAAATQATLGPASALPRLPEPLGSSLESPCVQVQKEEGREATRKDQDAVTASLTFSWRPVVWSPASDRKQSIWELSEAEQHLAYCW